ncbi:Kelch 1 and Kelch 5 domain containing protein [Trichuris trichiura]|uniref:Kelch domain-containing protein 10 n=1 Tax=Trichuris trichiura TaxID=36087 RepID=A0A077Z185_TRITR|nr:Kelch 1 and Kelch 5 domain containing protein [Trichuris trichiura]
MDVEEVPTYKFTVLEAPPPRSGRLQFFRHLFEEFSVPRRPQPRSGHRMVSFDELIISVGGYSTEHSDNGIIKEVWIMNPHTESWRPLQTTGTIPENLASHAMVRIGYSIVLFGGSGYPFGTHLSDDLYILSLRTGVWRRYASVGNAPMPLYGQAVTAHEKKLYVIGGTDGSFYCMDVHVIDFDQPHPSWVKLSSDHSGNEQPKPRYRHEATWYKNALYIFGGGTGTSSFKLNPLPVFDLETRQWKKLSAHPDPIYGYPVRRRAFGFVRYKDVVYLCGGINETNLLNDVWRFNLQTSSWSRLKCRLPYETAFHGCAITEGGCLTVFGGITDHGGNRRTCCTVRRWMVPPPLRIISLEKIGRFMSSNFKKQDSPFLEIEKSNTDVIKWLVDQLRQV